MEWNVGGAIKRPAIRKHEDRKRPAALAGNRRCRSHVQLVYIWTLFPVNLNADESVV